MFVMDRSAKTERKGCKNKFSQFIVDIKSETLQLVLSWIFITSQLAGRHELSSICQGTHQNQNLMITALH